MIFLSDFLPSVPFLNTTLCVCVCVPLALDVCEMAENLSKLRGTQARTSLLKNSRQPITEGR